MKKTILFVKAWLVASLLSTSLVFSQSDQESDQSLFSDENEQTGQDPAGETTIPGAEFNEDAVTNSDEPIDNPENNQNNKPADNKASMLPQVPESEDGGLGLEFEDEAVKDSRVSIVQNAVLEGIQISKEPGEVADERIVTCYFIFRDKPTSYFYEARPKQKLIVFEFNDVVKGVSPIPSQSEDPITGFKVESEKVDANKDVVGLNPEWHDILKVSLAFEAIPEITVKDEYSVISFSFRWSTDPNKQKIFVQKDGGNKVLLFSLIGGAIALGGGVGAILFLNNDDGGAEKEPLEGIHNVIKHPNTNSD